MTCIVGIREGGRVWIGGDSAGVGGLDMTVRADVKVFQNGPLLMGFTTSFRMGQLLRYSMSVPTPSEGEDVFAFMVTKVVNSIRDCLKSGGWASRDKDQEIGGHFLVGYRGRLFSIQGDYQVGERVDGFEACGCGESFALGSLAETDGRPPADRIARALTTAERFSAGVRGPFTILSDGEPERPALAKLNGEAKAGAGAQ